MRWLGRTSPQNNHSHFVITTKRIPRFLHQFLAAPRPRGPVLASVWILDELTAFDFVQFLRSVNAL